MKYIFSLLLGMVILAATAQKRTYEYDDFNRLSKVYVYNGTTLTHTITYNYDEMGNRLSKVVSTSTTPTQTIAINSPISGTFTAGQSVSVSYASTNGSANVSLELVSCTGTTALAVISANAAASGSITYTLPSNLTAGSYRIKSYITGTPEQEFYGSCFTVNASSDGDCPPTISHSGNITANTYQASQTIVSTANVPNNTKYYAGQSVTLSPGFSVGPNENFEVRVQGCNTSTAPTNGLVLHLPFNNNANDVSGNNFNGTASGNVTYAARGTGQSLNVSANTGQYITVPNNTTLQNLSNMSLSAWVKPTAFNLACYTEREMVIGKGKDVSATAFAMSITRNTQAGCGNASSFTTYKMSFEMNGNSIFSDTYSVDSQWRHVICTYDGTTQKIYINGVLVQQQNIGTVNTSNTLPLYVNYATWNGGASNSNGRFGGGIDDIRIYNRAITDAEVQQIYDAEKP